MRRCVSLLLLMMLLVLSASCLAWATPLEEIRQILREKSLKPPAESQLAAMSEENLLQKLRELDSYARYFESDDYHSPLTRRESWVGIGADLVEQDGQFFLAVYQGGAAELAGIADHSRLIDIDGNSVADVDAKSIADRLKGAEGTSVSLFVEQPGGRKIRFQVEREVFSPLDVERVTPGEHHVLRIRRFIGGLTRPALLATLDFLGRESGVATDAGSDLLIIDLRDAGGGDLFEAFDMAGVFLPQGTHLGSMYKRAGDYREIRATGGEKFRMPLVLLVGPETASAAEVFAGILQQHGRAKLIGQRTFGKCTTQTDVHLADGSVLRFTNGEVRLPDGRSCSGVGLQPDRDVRDAELRDLTWLVSEADALL